MAVDDEAPRWQTGAERVAAAQTEPGAPELPPAEAFRAFVGRVMAQYTQAIVTTERRHQEHLERLAATVAEGLEAKARALGLAVPDAVAVTRAAVDAADEAEGEPAGPDAGRVLTDEEARAWLAAGRSRPAGGHRG